MKKGHLPIMRVFFLPIVLALSILTAGCASTAKPGVSDQTVVVLANEALATTLNYSYANYPQQFQAASQYFTAAGWENYLEALRISKTLVRVEKEQMVASAVAQGAPMIVSKDTVNGRYTWKVQAPMLLTYENAQKHIKQSALVTLIIVRQDDQRGVRGLAVDQLLIQATPAKEERLIKKVITKKITVTT